MLKGQKLELEIESMSHGAHGIARNGSKIPIFIENTCPGDKLFAEVYDDRRTFAFASIQELIKASESRNANPKCPLHKVCGGCQWQQIDYKKQLESKRKNIIDLLVNEKVLDKSWREDYKKDPSLIPEVLGMDDPWNYRNKIVYPVGTKENGRVVAGYYKRNSHDLINIKYCPVQYSVFDEIMAFVKEECSKNAIKKPWLRHIAMRANHDQSQILLTFIVRTKTPIYKNKIKQSGSGAKKPLRKASEEKTFMELKAKLKKVAAIIKEKFPKIVGISSNYNDLSTNVILGQEMELILGESFMLDKLNDLSFKVSPTSFFQINNEQAEKLVDKVVEFADLKEGAKVLDAYSGTGSLALALAENSKAKVLGIEAVESSVKDARENAKLNKLESVDFKLSKLEDSISEIVKEKYDLLVTNPPRKGCTNKVLDAFGKIGSEKIVYVSCNPASLARDIKYLEQFGYSLKTLQPIDLFPHTYHIESVALLTK